VTTGAVSGTVDSHPFSPVTDPSLPTSGTLDARRAVRRGARRQTKTPPFRRGFRIAAIH
jgi:hypothetical protein